MTVLTAAQARRIAVAAQGFTGPKPRGSVTRAHLRRLIARIQLLQLDSVSVAVRAHYAPVFSRLGPYDRDVLDRAAWSHGARSPRLLVEYWAHEAALMAVDDATRSAGPPRRRPRGDARTGAAGGDRAGGGHRGRHPRLLSAVGFPGRADDRQAGQRRRARAGGSRRVGCPGVSAGWAAHSAS